MPRSKAIIFDFIGTLANVKGYNMQQSTLRLCQALIKTGFNIDEQHFLKAYAKAHEKYRIIRYGKLVEVTNAVWISETLNNLGFDTRPENSQIKTAVNIFFLDFVKSLQLRPCAKTMLKKASNHKLGLISNFTYAPVIHAGLRKLDISRFFNSILVSHEVGWRKPSSKIFMEALKRLEVAAEETTYIGDSPSEDIKGAKAVGMATIFVPSQFYSLDDLVESKQEPDLTVKDVCELCKELPKFCNSA